MLNILGKLPCFPTPLTEESAQLGLHLVHNSSVTLPATSLLPTLWVLSLKFPWQLFNTLQPHEDHTSDIDGVVNHRDWSTATLTQLFSLTYILFRFLSYTDCPPLTMADCQSRWGPLSCWRPFFSRFDLILLFCPSSPSLLSPDQGCVQGTSLSRLRSTPRMAFGPICVQGLSRRHLQLQRGGKGGKRLL